VNDALLLAFLGLILASYVALVNDVAELRRALATRDAAQASKVDGLEETVAELRAQKIANGG